MTARKKRNAIIWPIVGGIPLLIIFSFFAYLIIVRQRTQKTVDRALNTYNVVYSSSEPLMEIVRKSEEEAKVDDGLYGFIYIDGERLELRCFFNRRTNLFRFCTAEEENYVFLSAYYKFKGDTLVLDVSNGDDKYGISKYKTITLTMTHLD